jgi:type IV pilus assembly protein PilC
MTLSKQLEFIWSGEDHNSKKLNGVITARSELIAKAELRRQGYRVNKIRAQSKPFFKPRLRKITSAEIASFSRQLATLINAGIPLVQAVGIICKGHENPSMQTLLSTIKTNLENGDSLANALKSHPEYFDELYCNLIAAGEKAGILDTLLDKVATYKEKTESIKKKIKKALTYPIAVIVVAFIVTTILLLFVVPVFEDMFKSFGAELPIFTQLVVNISKWISQYWWLILGIISVGIFCFCYFKKRSVPFNHFLDNFLLELPLVGLILNKSAIARFSRTLSTMSAAGVPLVDALQSVAGACGNIIYKEAVLKMREQVATGQRLQFAMQQTNMFPNMVQQMIAVGEESGSMDMMLSKVADFYEEEVDNLVNNLSSLLEPIIMVILGILIGGLIIAMYLPIFKMGAAIG